MEAVSLERRFPRNFEKIVDHGSIQIFEGSDNFKDIYVRLASNPAPIAIQTSEKPILGHHISITIQLKEDELSADDKLKIEAALPVGLTEEDQFAAARGLAEGSLQTLYAHFNQLPAALEQSGGTLPENFGYYHDAAHNLEVYEGTDSNQAVVVHLKAEPSPVHLWRGQSLATGHLASVTARMRHSHATANHYVVARTAMPEGLSEGERFMRAQKLAEGTLSTLYLHFTQICE